MFKHLSATLVAGLVVASPAYAREPEAPTRLVKTSDLDLSRADQRAKLQRRIHFAARSVCRDTSSMGFADQTEVWRCVQKAIGATRPQVAALFAKHGVEVASSGSNSGQ